MLPDDTGYPQSVWQAEKAYADRCGYQLARGPLTWELTVSLFWNESVESGVSADCTNH